MEFYWEQGAHHVTYVPVDLIMAKRGANFVDLLGRRGVVVVVKVKGECEGGDIGNLDVLYPVHGKC